jgi:predicted alpha/beta hydrolase
VVLSHMGRGGDNQEDWFGMAAVLADEGYVVLTYNRRGVCPGGVAGCSDGDDDYTDHWLDVLGAVDFLRTRGAERVFIGGASIGAMASLYAAEQPGTEVDGLIWVAGVLAGAYFFQRDDIQTVRVP